MRPPSRKCRPRSRPTIEFLETRLTPATSTWSGAISALWSNNGNWDVPPAAGNDLVFPSGATSLTSTNDLAAGTSFASVSIAAGGYAITGDAITLTGAIDASQASGTSTFNLPLTLAAPAPTVTVDNAAAILSLGGAVGGATGLTKAGAGTLSLKVANAYTGTTAVSAGALVVDGAQPGGAVTLASGTTLSGTGTVGGIAATSATVRPGDGAPGLLTDSGPLTLDTDSTFAVSLAGAAVGTGYSQLSASGAIDLGGAALSTTLSFTPTANETFTIVNNTGGSAVTGTFDGLAEGATFAVNGTAFRISYVGGDGNDVVLTELVNTTTAVTADPNPAGLNQPVTLTATVSVVSPGTGLPTGSVEFFSGNTSLGTAPLNGSAFATLAHTFTALETETITAKYVGDTGFATSTSSALSLPVRDASATSLAVSPTSTTYGMTVTLTATVTPSGGSGTPTGTVQFFRGSTSLGTAALNGSGVATFATGAIAAGTGLVTAEYLGSSTFGGSTSAATSVTVAQAPTTTTLAADPTTPSFGQTVTLTATVASATGTPTGTVQFFAGATQIGTGTLNGSGVATFSTTTLPIGASSITATYVTDGNFTGSSTAAATTVTVAQASTTTAVSASPSPASVNQAVTLTATVSVVSPGAGLPTGNVEFFNGSTSLGTAPLNGSAFATLSTTFSTVGSNSITAKYVGDAKFTTSTSTAVTLAVRGASTTTLAVSPTPSVFGQSVTLTATVTPSTGSGTPTGTVTFSSGSTTLGTGTLTSTLNGVVATLTTTALVLGSNSITATYAGDTNFTTSTSTAATATVTQASSTTTVTASPSSPALGAAVTLTATVAAASPGSGTPAGTVTFFAGATSLGTGTLSASGVATLTTSTLSAGANSITAVYQGGTNFATSTSPAIAVNVALIATTTTLTASRQATLGGAVTLTTTVAAASGTAKPTGAVTFFQGSTRLGTATLDANGVATFSATGLPLGNTAVSAVYGGDSTHATSTSSTAIASVGSDNQIFVNQVYLAVLGRPAEAKGLAYWSSLLNTQVPRRRVVRGILNSREGARASVESIFESIYGTSPTRGQVYTATHLGNPTALNITANILGSRTFYKTSGGTIDGFLGALGNIFVGSDLPAGMSSTFARELRGGTSTLRIAQQFLSSDLGVNSVIDSLYFRYFGREADRTGLSFYSRLVHEGFRPGQVTVNILGSTEYLDLALSEITADDSSGSE